LLLLYKLTKIGIANARTRYATEKLSEPQKGNIGTVLFSAVAGVTQARDKTLQVGGLPAAKQHLAWRHFRGPPL
jgi:hypothetical protein